ncbi:ROK family protein [Hymenobacter terrenus]|uniref:ROK family protein n=1 Tax=Hymenobacter terrenus TaxID=1629124 RepID=UPI000619FE73|nr:ROK family protein [Hymenobacter terrenus]
MSQAIGIDLGGTRIKGVLVDTATGAVGQQLLTPTGGGAGQAWKQAITATVQALQAQAAWPLLGVGLSAPGLPTSDNAAIACMLGRHEPHRERAERAKTLIVNLL